MNKRNDTVIICRSGNQGSHHHGNISMTKSRDDGSSGNNSGTSTSTSPTTTTTTTTTTTSNSKPNLPPSSSFGITDGSMTRSFRRSTKTTSLMIAVTVIVMAATMLRQHLSFLNSSNNHRLTANLPPFMWSLQDNKAVVTQGPFITNNSTAACLLMFDDNLSLVEWLAYHYHTMNLRHVIVLSDPRSTESPVPILQRYREHQLMTYEVWDETRVFPTPEILRTLRDTGDLVQLHRNRQSYFYAQCMRELKLRQQYHHQQQQQQQPTQAKSRLVGNKKDDNHDDDDAWLLLTDVDEYVAINPRVLEKSHKLYRPHMMAKLSNSDNHAAQQEGQQQNMVTASWLEPPGAILNFLRHEKHTPPCLHMARRDMVSQESDFADIAVGVPSFLNATSFYTARWRYQSHRRITGKCLVDMARVRLSQIPVQSPRQGHVPLPQCPARGAKYRYTMENTPLVVHHYLGTQTQYQHRDDPRRDRTTDGFAKKQRYPTEVRDTVRSWLTGFVRDVGPEMAAKLLDGAGTIGGGVVPSPKMNQTRG